MWGQNFPELQLNRPENCFVADSSKFDSDALIKVCGLDDVDIVVTETRPAASFLESVLTKQTALCSRRGLRINLV